MTHSDPTGLLMPVGSGGKGDYTYGTVYKPDGGTSGGNPSGAPPAAIQDLISQVYGSPTDSDPKVQAAIDAGALQLPPVAPDRLRAWFRALVFDEADCLDLWSGTCAGEYVKLTGALTAILSPALWLEGRAGRESMAPGRLPTVEARPPGAADLAEQVAAATGGALKQSGTGYTVRVPQGTRGVVVRVMESGGGRNNYYRVSVPGKQAFTIDGIASADRALTHIDITASSLQDILRIVRGAG